MLLFHFILCPLILNRIYYAESCGVDKDKNKTHSSSMACDNFPKDFVSHVDLGNIDGPDNHYVLLFKSDPQKSQVLLQLPSNISTGYQWFPLAVFPAGENPAEPYNESLKDLLTKDNLVKNGSEGLSDHGLVLTPFASEQQNVQKGFVGGQGVSKATLSFKDDASNGDFVLFLVYARSFSPLTDPRFKKVHVRVI